MLVLVQPGRRLWAPTALSSTPMDLPAFKLYANQDNDTIRLTGPTVETSLFGGKGEDSLQIRNTLTSSYIEANSGNDTIDVTARIENTFLHAGQGR